MSGLPPGDPQLVSMIVSHLKTQGLFDQFRRECLADVDTKPAYLNLKQRVDNFVSNHLSNHTWSPHLNKNQLRNNIRQLVLQSGMLEQGVDRIVAQVVDPKINHIFRPQVERVVREFLSPGSCSDEPMTPLPPADLKADAGILEQALSSTPATSTTSDAMSILDTISSLNQEASVRSSSATEKGRKILASDDTGLLVEENGQDISVEDGDENQDRKLLEETQEMMEVSTSDVKEEETGEFMEPGREGLTEEVKVEEEGSGGLEQTEEEKDKLPSKSSGKPSEEKPDDEVLRSKNQAKQKAKERIKEEYSLEDSDLEGLSDITVSSVHTSDLSSFEEDSDEEEQLSDSSEEGELSDDDGKKAEKRHASEEQGEEDKERKPCRKAYVHKPFLYSRYYSDSDDEVTVEERRRSAAKDKEERLLKRQQNRERMEEKLKQKAAQAEQQDLKKQKSADSAGLEGPKAKEARKERKVLEKKMALNRKRKLDSRKEGDVSSKKKVDPGDTSKRAELKPSTSKTPQPKFVRNLSESGACDERHKRMSATISEESSDTKKLMEKAVTHAFILELEQGSQEALKQRSFGKFDRPSRKELHLKERKDKERSLSDDRIKPKQKQEKKSEQQVDESQHKEGAAAKGSSEEKAEKKLKTKSEKKLVSNTKDGKVAEGVVEDGNSKDAKKPKGSVECLKVEKDKEKREKEKIKEKEKAKGEKSLVKSEFKQLLCPDSAGSSEDRSDLETGPDGKKKDKHSKEVLKKSKSHTEPGDRPRLKSESEKEKTKPDQDSPKAHKPSSETDKDPKKVKSTEKGKILEKSKTKSKEESKAQVGPKTDKKTQSPDVKNAGAPPVSKLEAKKDKKKDGNVKDQLKVSEEAPSDKSGLKVGKKKALKKDNVTEKKDEDKVHPPEGKSEKSDKSSKVSVSTLTSAAEDPPKNQLLHQDTSAESVPSADNTLFSEPPEDNTELRLQMPQLPAEADALLTLMDVCASAEARLPSHSLKEEEAPEAELQDADMKMKEAALTLLSMDPDSTLSSSLICQDAKMEEEEPASPTVQQLLEASANEQERLPASQEQATPESDLTIPETSTAALQSENGVEGSTNTAEEGENADRQTDAARPERSDVEAAQENAAILTSSKEKHAEDADIPAESHLEEKESGDEEMADVASEETEEITASTGQEMVDVVPKATENVCETCSESEQKEADAAVTEPNLWRIEAEADQNHTEMDAGYVEAQREEEKDEHGAEESDLLTVEADFSERMDVVVGPELEFPQDKKISEVSVTDIQEEDSSSDQEAEEKPSEVKLSVQEDTLNEESGDRRDEKETKELQPAEESEEGKGMEVQTHPSEGKSKTVLEEERDQSEELEKPKDSQSSSDVSVTSPTVDSLTDGSRTEHSREETSSLHAAEVEKAEDQKEPERSGAEVGPPFSGSEEHKRPEKEESTKTTEICQSARKRKISEETEEPAEESQTEKEVKELSTQGGEDNSDHPTSVSLSDDVKHESGAGKKPDEGQEKHQDDQETPPKRRRGRPPKSALVEDSDQKEKKAPEKESEHADEEEEEDSEKEDEEKGSATRATTRLASRLEAERNKLSKPSTRASRQGGKEEAAAGARGTRGPAAVRGGRKREASPPAVRTRGGQKSEEPASKRAKR